MSETKYLDVKNKEYIKDALIEIFVNDSDFRNKFFEMLEDFLLANAIDEGMKTKDVEYEIFERKVRDLLLK